MNVQIEKVTLAAKPLLANLMQLYLYDFSEIDGDDVNEDGRYQYPYLDAYWTEPKRYPFIIRADGQITGFVLVRDVSTSETERCHAIAEFFIMRKYRRHGVGRQAAHAVFNRFPHKWRVSQIAGNLEAQKFWRRVIGEYTNRRYQEQTLKLEHRAEVIQEFWAHATQPT